MQRPWTEEEDQRLREGVKQFGCQWAMVQNQMNKSRSIDSILRRWNKKIRYEKYRPRKTEQDKANKDQTLISKVRQDPIIQLAKREYYQPHKPVILENENELDEQEDEQNWKKAWTEREDKKLKLLAIESGVLSWKTLAETLEADLDQTKLRWKKVIYPNMIKQGSKVGGSLKWSLLQDRILNFGFKQGIDWEEEGRLFLPNRSLGSIEARWRRVAKNFEVKQISQNRHLAVRQCLRRIARKEREATQNKNKLQNASKQAQQK